MFQIIKLVIVLIIIAGLAAGGWYVTKKRAGYSQGCIVVYRGFVKGTLVPLISKADSAWLIVKNGTLPVKH